MYRKPPSSSSLFTQNENATCHIIIHTTRSTHRFDLKINLITSWRPDIPPSRTPHILCPPPPPRVPWLLVLVPHECAFYAAACVYDVCGSVNQQFGIAPTKKGTFLVRVFIDRSVDAAQNVYKKRNWSPMPATKYGGVELCQIDFILPAVKKTICSRFQQTNRDSLLPSRLSLLAQPNGKIVLQKQKNRRKKRWNNKIAMAIGHLPCLSTHIWITGFTTWFTCLHIPLHRAKLNIQRARFFCLFQPHKEIDNYTIFFLFNPVFQLQLKSSFCFCFVFISSSLLNKNQTKSPSIFCTKIHTKNIQYKYNCWLNVTRTYAGAISSKRKQKTLLSVLAETGWPFWMVKLSQCFWKCWLMCVCEAKCYPVLHRCFFAINLRSILYINNNNEMLSKEIDRPVFSFTFFNFSVTRRTRLLLLLAVVVVVVARC